MPPTKQIKRRKPKIDVRAATRDWLLHNEAAKTFGEKATALKALLMETLAEIGDLDERGSRYIRFDGDPVEGKITALKREFRSSKRLDPMKAEAYLRDKGLYDQCVEMVPTLNEAAVLGLNFTKVIPDEDLEALYEVSETYAFVPQRAQ